MTKATLTIGERLGAVRILNDGKFTNLELASVLEDIKKFAVSEEDWAAANLRKTPSDEDIKALPPEERLKTAQTWNWDETVEKEVEISADTASYIVGEIKKKSDAKELTLADAALITLQKKLS